MALNQLVDTRDSRFVLFDLLKIDSLVQYERFKDFDRESFEATLDLAEKLAVEKLYRANREGDAEGATYDAATKSVKVPKAYHAAWAAYVESGFPFLIAPPEYGGMGMPEVVWKGAQEYLMAGCIPLIMYSTLPIGAYQIIYRYGSDEQKAKYLPKMIAGEWGGTMCLTESVAGSDVGALKTRAIPQKDGTYKIVGSKIFITAGDHDLCENIIHPVLARIEGDPEGTKGISIFLVPKYLVNDDGSLGRRNDMNCSGIEHKMGIRGSATCSLNYGDQDQCVGYLLGEARQGMSIMFDMMNAARLEVGLQGLATASAAYMHAVTYAKSRIQGMNPANRALGAVRIIEHADVRRMLLSMKSYLEAMRIITHLCGLQYDLTEASEGNERQQAQELLDFLIPICKAGNTDNAWTITGEAIQVYGGYGYCAEYPVEQYARDSKIYAIYEGTNGIQSMDLLMRKLLMNPGLTNYKTYKAKIASTLKEYETEIPATYREQINRAVKRMDQAVQFLADRLKEQKLPQVMANAVPLQKAFKLLSYAWAHVWSMGITLPRVDAILSSGGDLKAKLKASEEAAYYHGRLRSAKFFMNCEFKNFDAQIDYILANDTEVALALEEEFTGALPSL